MGIKEDEVRLLISKAQQRIQVAIRMLHEGFLEDAINRAYYAAFYAALAALFTKGIRTRRHSTVLSLFGYYFARTGEIEEEYARIYRRLKEIRESADYDVYAFFEEEEIRDAVDQARRFVDRIKEYLKQIGILD